MYNGLTGHILGSLLTYLWLVGVLNGGALTWSFLILQTTRVISTLISNTARK